MRKLAYIETFGCQMNAVDSARMLALLAAVDYGPAPSLAEADLALLNTCSIREKADQKIFSALGQLRSWKRRRPGRIVAVGGCLAQQAGEDVRRRAPHVDIVFGTHNIARLPEMVRAAAEGGISSVALEMSGDVTHWDVPPYLPDGAASAMVTIMQGCDNFCAYCIVPRVRGPEISRPAKEIVAEVEALAGHGVREVVLLGQNVNSYGRKEGEIAFPALLRSISRVPGIARIRFVTSHPRDLDEETIRLFSEIEALCPHVHLPAQSGSDRVLAAMGRGYTRKEYAARIEALRRARPGMAFSSDFIVGFPGETDADFAETLSLMDEVRYDSCFSFRFSPRPGTRAAEMPNGAPAGTAEERLRALQALQDRHTRERLSACVGKEMEVLVEGASARDPSRFCGRTPCCKTVNFTPARGDGGSFRRVLIRSAGAHSLSGEEGGAHG
ncbi:MAG: tRNA (N6-isopentenyl adenosine(37)-C2)-methylthiotransferase MiaB [Deltaproteobacteria bacterium]|nr:tRNA (N6-isopentenyl adenosine(37)-C2)-methylthiotransferase MiaB [Deltaproteobacteria bacterium]